MAKKNAKADKTARQVAKLVKRIDVLSSKKEKAVAKANAKFDKRIAKLVAKKAKLIAPPKAAAKKDSGKKEKK